MYHDRAIHQDIRPLEIIILNLMPTKVVTETQILRLLGNTPLQVKVSLLRMITHKSKNTSEEYLSTFYTTLLEIKYKKFDGLIITGGAPVETLNFEDVDYWEELKDVMSWSKNNVFLLYIFVGGVLRQGYIFIMVSINTPPLIKKIFGVFEHTLNDKSCKLVRGFDDIFWVPHSRHTEIKRQDIEPIPDLNIISESKDAGVYLIERKDGRQVFVTGHPEYDPIILKHEYERDINKGMDIPLPKIISQMMTLIANLLLDGEAMPTFYLATG